MMGALEWAVTVAGAVLIVAVNFYFFPRRR